MRGCPSWPRRRTSRAERLSSVRRRLEPADLPHPTQVQLGDRPRDLWFIISPSDTQILHVSDAYRNAYLGSVAALIGKIDALTAAFRLIGASGERSDLAAGTRCDLFLLSGRRRGRFDAGAVSLFRNLEPTGLLLANVWALPVLG
jgi:hypothetical protein